MFYFSKSRYCRFCQCPKSVWLQKNKPEEEVLSDDVFTRMTTGNEVGDLAMGIFGDYVEVTAYKEDGRLDLEAMTGRTAEEMAKGTPVICEASFMYEGLYCAVDILRKTDGGWAIYEVKSSTHDDKKVYFKDIAYQRYVLERCGVNVTGTYLMVIDNSYILDGELDISRLFKITDVSSQISDDFSKVPENLKKAKEILSMADEPDIDLSVNCLDPYKCSFWDYCTRNLPRPSVFDIYNLWKSKKFQLYHMGVTTFEDLERVAPFTNKIQKRQVEYGLHDRDTYVEKANIRKFLAELHYPLYFLDFESVQPAIPVYQHSKPYAQIPFQYSLHYIEREGGSLEHREFLAESGTDPRRAIAESLCENIPENGCILAYNKAFECTRIKELAGLFPDLSGHLMTIEKHIIDLVAPFREGAYYNRAMGGSFSIKSVLPAIFPDDPGLDYHNLEGVHNGTEAMNIFPQMEFMDEDERETARRNLLKYCELDTYALVKIWQELVRVSAED